MHISIGTGLDFGMGLDIGEADYTYCVLQCGLDAGTKSR